ncbi:MAG TPA: cob(I)yrinic acid a,c-diamide adenosyltransferase [Coriobacteriia bacterium]|nr:cob(I)yrinic acid a,c-diamide adenosyltransferase [Coriobacteriia bacterium]
MSIYTRSGDDGQTSLADGSRVSKSSLRVEAYGTVDEANSAIGFARAAGADELLDSVLGFAQQRLFNCASRLATPNAESAGAVAVSAEDVAFLERAIDRFEKTSGPLAHFVVESGSELASRLHIARATVRRAERRVVNLADSEHVDAHVLAFVNRLADALFAAARYANAVAEVAEEAWDPKAEPPAL